MIVEFKSARISDFCRETGRKLSELEDMMKLRGKNLLKTGTAPYRMLFIHKNMSIYTRVTGSADLCVIGLPELLLAVLTDEHEQKTYLINAYLLD